MYNFLQFWANDRAGDVVYSNGTRPEHASLVGAAEAAGAKAEGGVMGSQILRTIVYSWVGILVSWVASTCNTDVTANLRWAAATLARVVVDVLFAAGKF